MKTIELHIGKVYRAFYYDPKGNLCYAGLVYYAGKGMCVNSLGYNMVTDTLPVHYPIFMPIEECESNNSRTITEFHSQPQDWNIDKKDVILKDVKSPWLPDYTWWQEFIKKHDLEIK